jgi:hypothetical protein
MVSGDHSRAGTNQGRQPGSSNGQTVLFINQFDVQQDVIHLHDVVRLTSITVDSSLALESFGGLASVATCGTNHIGQASPTIPNRVIMRWLEFNGFAMPANLEDHRSHRRTLLGQVVGLDDIANNRYDLRVECDGGITHACSQIAFSLVIRIILDNYTASFNVAA